MVGGEVVSDTPMAERFQIQRTRGWRKPDNGVLLTRPHSRWANPYPVEQYGHAASLHMYRVHLAELYPELIESARVELVGKALGCWCPTDQPCHIDVLLELLGWERQ